MLLQVMSSVIGSGIKKKMGIAMSGMAKVFVGELIESGKDNRALTITQLAKSAMDESEEGGALRPAHIRTAFRRLKTQGKLPHVPNTLSL
jgi:transcription initiation factor TFIID subunit 11